MPSHFAIIDIETTGGLAKRDRITEIAIVVSDGKKIIKQYDSLVNPGISIPYNITRITGIDDSMVEGAPKFYEIAKEVVKFTEDTIFVAHNVQFDYSFIQNAFASLGYTFSKRRLCTVKMSRKAFPGLKSYSLGNLIKHFGIKVNDRHRALEDALATTDIFHKILAKDPEDLGDKHWIKKGIKLTQLPEGISEKDVDELPEKIGTYYMLDMYGEIVYIGKSVNIKKRIKQHFSKVDGKTKKMLQTVRSIRYELTGSELSALVKEAIEIKKLAPEINKALRISEFPYAVYFYPIQQTYIQLKAGKISPKIQKEAVIVSTHKSSKSSKSYLKSYTESLDLCKQINKLETNTGGPCFDYSLNKCLGACIELESSESYNERVNELLDFQDQFNVPNFFIIDKGRSEDENSVFLIEENKFKGYGYISSDDVIMGAEELKESIEYIDYDKQINSIVKTHMNQHPYLRTIPF